MSRAESSEFSRGWPLLVAAVAGIALGPAAVSLTYTLGPLTPSLLATFGWSRAELLLVGPCLLVGALIATQVAGWLLDRVEPRIVLVASQIAFGLCFLALAAFLNGLASLWTLYALLGVTGAGASPLAFVKVISGVFEARRGLAIGIALAGTGISGALAPAMITALVAHGGWRLGYACIGGLVLLVAAPLSWLLVPRRAALRGEAATSLAEAAPAAPAVGPTLGEALRSSPFWLLAVAFALAAGAVTALVASLVPLLIEGGRTPAQAAGLTGIVGLAVIVGRVGVGYLLDRLWGPGVGALVIGAAAIAAWSLTLAGLSTWGVAAAIFVIGLATGAEFDLNGFLTTRYFGTASLGRIYGLQYSALAVGSGLAAPLAGWLRDRSADYHPLLFAVGAAFAVCAALLLALGPYPELTSPPSRRPRAAPRR